jgi:hypothetical protein
VGRSNPLVAEAVRGLAGAGPAQLAYLNYLLIQAAVLFIWWPKSGLAEVIEAGDAPYTLLATIIAMGVTIAYYSILAGADEHALPGQHSLREWVLVTPLALSRVLSGYLVAHAIQTLHAMALSAPLVLVAWSVAGGDWSALSWCLAMIWVQALFYRLVGAVLSLTVGHYVGFTFLALRAALLAGYLAAPLIHPATSQLVVSYRLLDERVSAGAELPEPTAFLVLYAVLSTVMTVVLYRLLSRHR